MIKTGLAVAVVSALAQAEVTQVVMVDDVETPLEDVIESPTIRNFTYYATWDKMVYETHNVGCEDTDCVVKRDWETCSAMDSAHADCSTEAESWWINTELVPDVNYDVIYEHCADPDHCTSYNGLRVEKCNDQGHDCKPVYTFMDYDGSVTEIVETMDCKNGVCTFKSSYKNMKNNWMHDKIKTCRVVEGSPAALVPRFSYGPLL